jgi:DNA polymerase-1
VFACGNLAMKMILRKSGITNKRGKAFEFESEEGHKCIVVPIFHPYACIKEPKNLSLFQTDIKNAHEMYILNRRREGDFKYKAIMNVEDLYDLTEKLKITFDTLAIDTETTGLNFRTDSIMTLSISSRDMTWVIPLDHKDSPFKKGTEEYSDAWFCIRAIMSNPNNKKVFHNAKFDLHFLLSYGITVENVWDTKIMHHLLDENMPKSLMDLTKLYFASELENL